MPKRHTNSDNSSSKAVRDKYAENKRLAVRIERSGCPVDSPCEYCFSRGKVCIMSSTARSKKCSACAMRGRPCERRFHSDKEWDDLQRNEERIAADLEQAQKRFLEYSQKMNQEMSKVLRLQKHLKFLKSRNGQMLDHDLSVSDCLNEENPLSAEDLQELEHLADEQEAAQLAAVSNDPSLTQMMNSPSFWENFDSAVAGGIPSPTGDNPLGSR